MAESGRILRALMELKRKAEGNFCEIKSKISRLESKFNLMAVEQDHIKKEIELGKTKQLLLQQPMAAPATRAARRGRRRAARRRRRGGAAARGARGGRKPAAGRVVRAASSKGVRLRRPATAKRP